MDLSLRFDYLLTRPLTRRGIQSVHLFNSSDLKVEDSVLFPTSALSNSIRLRTIVPLKDLYRRRRGSRIKPGGAAVA